MANQRIRNLSWILCEKFGVLGVSVLSFLVYAFALTPAEMGIAALALAVVESFGVVYGNLIEDPLVRQPERARQCNASAFWLGGLLSLVTMALLGGGFYFASDDPLFVAIMTFASIKILLVVLARPFIAALRQQRNFKALATRTLAGKLLGAFAGIALALSGAGAWAVVAQALVMDLFSLVVLMYTGGSLMRGTVSAEKFAALVKEGLPIALRSFCKSSLIRGVTILLGLTTSATTVGYFAFANRLVSLPSQAISNGLLSYALPAIASRHGRGESLAPFVKQLSVSATLIMLPVFFGAAAISPTLIPMIFGEKWAASVFVFQVLAVVAGIRCVVLFVPPTLAAVGRARIGLQADLVNVLATLAFIYFLGPTLGIMSALIAMSIHVGFDVVIKAYSLKRVTEQPNRGWLTETAKILLAATLMLLVASQSITLVSSPALANALAVCLGGLTFIAVVQWLTPDWLLELRRLIGRNNKQ